MKSVLPYLQLEKLLLFPEIFPIGLLNHSINCDISIGLIAAVHLLIACHQKPEAIFCFDDLL
jgi:hypothetical protein